MDWKTLLDELKNPPAKHRAAPFYSWNAELENDELRRQIRIMHEMGMGGAFMHSRVGLATPYLSEEWFDRIRTCADEAQKCGMNAWLYDEDRWPSGAAGGIVTKDLKYRRRCLVTFELKSGDPVPSANKMEPLVALYAISFATENVMKSYRRIRKPSQAKAGEKIYAMKRVIEANSPWYNGQAYLDVLNSEAVRKFIEVTHEAYRKKVGDLFENSLPGIFTDEPNFCAPLPNAVPWTDSLPETFSKKYGYDLLEQLPELYWQKESEQVSRVRLNFRTLLAELFALNFNKQIFDWCEKNHLLYTGHMLNEDNMYSQWLSIGSAMRQYEYMQAPGIDLLTEHWNLYVTAKQCSSMAHQFGRERRLTETYGCTGWDFPFFGHKALSDWQLALGINLRVPHLSWYSMEGQAKRDYPASISYQSPWYKNYREVEDPLSRTSSLITHGEEQRDLLLVHGIESYLAGKTVFPTAEPDKDEERDIKVDLAECDENFNKLALNLLEAHLDFDFGEEDVMARHGKVKTGAISIAKASYKAVLIPEMTTIRGTTLDLLSKFAKKGGLVAYLGTAPQYMDGIPSDKPAKIYGAFRSVTRDNMIAKLEGSVRRVSVADETGNEFKPVLYMLRKTEKWHTLFCCNTSQNASDCGIFNAPFIRDRQKDAPSALITLKGMSPSLNVYEADTATGKLFSVKTCSKGGALAFCTGFAPLQSRVFLITADKLSAENRPAQGSLCNVLMMPESGWTVEMDDPNVLVLDQFDYSVGGKAQPKDYILNIDKKLREMLGKACRGGAMVQPWLTKNHPAPKRELDLSLKVCFSCKDIPAACDLALEHPEWFKITLNGKSVKQTDRGYWVDRSCRRISLPVKAFRQGENELVFRGKYHEYLSGLEAMFLLGDFRVKNDTLEAPAATLNCGTVTTQGLPYYSGNLIYRQEIDLRKLAGKRYEFRFGQWRGVSLAVRVNGSEWIATPYPPFAADITKLLRNGKNVIELRVLGSRRNAFGPFYCKGVLSPDFCGAWQLEMFEQTTRNVVPFGLLSAPDIAVFER